ncbi:N,N-dimethylformamidase beta subunit family domain-containing protein [Herbidospora mongoliensis]|uniref:N,N-dimethylformamidase beta subunit family domain-containing protein n=1 Tax=Herbidospora mongoliensis TaxID=688067 RepID=UPI000831A270|nr:N,N-dimethylformamidase beta subunit family domain-containing protein [Herbidospora mongoliensis]
MSGTYPTPRNAWSPDGWPSPRPTGEGLEAWCYTDRFSYHPGETVAVSAYTTADRYSLTVIRDGAHPEVVHTHTDLPGTTPDTPQDAYAEGCGWPVTARITIPGDWPSAMYLLVIRAELDGKVIENEHFFVVRSADPGRRTPYALVLSTSTLISYNDWGGANAYRGLGDDPAVDVFSPRLSMHRPLSRGFLRKPPGAPRNRYEEHVPPFWEPRYPVYEWARLRDYGRHHADAFWATYERPFAVWAEQQGYDLDYLTQNDLDRDPAALDGYQCAILVGHDEYWSWKMRDAIDKLVGRGGNVARFGANFAWQVRMEGATQVCHKYVPEDDPIFGTADRHLVTLNWDHPLIGRPGAATMGLTGFAGVYAGYGASAPRGHGGLQVYRPEHWTLAGTDLYYGDLLGGHPARIATFEVDGCAHVVQDGLPFATGADGAPGNLEIIAMGPAVRYEEDHFGGTVPLGDPGSAAIEEYRDSQWVEREDGSRRPTYGSAMMATFTRGDGTVFNSGTSEWVAGLIHRDWFVEHVTRTVLDRLGGTA